MDGSNDGSPDHAIEENEVAKMTAKPQDPSPEPGSQTATAVAAPAAVQMNADGDHPLAPLHPSIPSLPPINHQQPPALPNANDSEQPSPPAAPADPPAQKTRGRPRKTPSDLNLNSNSTADTSADKDSGASFPVDSSATAGAKENDEAVADPQVKRKRGRPPGSRNKKRVKTDISFSAGAAAASAATTGGPATTAATSTMSISPGVTGRQKRYELKFRNAAAKMDTSDFVRMVTLEFQRRGFGLAIKLEPLHSDNEKGAEGQKEGHQSDSRGADGKNHDGVQMGEERNRAENGDHGDGDDVHAVSEQEDEKDKEKERDNSNDNANISKGPGIGETTDNGTNDTATATTAATAIKLKPTKRRIAKYDPKNPIPPPFPFYPSTVRVTPQKDAKWNEMFQQLQTFYLRYGHVNIPPDNANLLAWVRRQKFLWNVMIRKKGSKNIASGATAATGPDGGLGGVSSTAGAAGGSSNNTTAAFITPSPLKPLNEDESSPDAVVKHNLSFDRICKLYSVGIGHRLKFYPPLAETGLLITPEGSAGKADKGKGGGSAGKGDKNDKSANGNSRKSKVNNTRKEDDSEDDENSINQEEGSRGPLLRIEQIVELLPEDNPHNIKGNEKWEMMLQRLREYKEAHGDTYVPRKNYEELSRWTFKNRQQCKRIMNGDFNTHLTKSRYLQLYELGFDLTGDEQKVKEKQRKNRERMLDRKWEEKYKELLDYYKEHGNCDVSRTRDGKEKYEKLAHWADTQRAKYKAKMKGKKSFLTDEQIKKLATIGFKFQLQDDFDTRFNQLLEYKREHGHTRVPVFYTGHNKLGRWAKRMRDGIRNNEPWLDEVRRARLIGIDFDIEARQVFDWGARKKKQQQEEEDDRKAKAAKDAAATMARMDLHVPRLEHNDHQCHQNQSPAQQQQQQEELHQSKYENQPQHQPPAQPHVTSHQQQQPPPTHHQPQHQHIIQLPHQPLNPVLASFTGMDADRAAAPYYPGYGHYPYHPYHSFPPS